MKGAIFIDSNVFLYAIDGSVPKMQAKAKAALAEVGPSFTTSIQVLQEVFVNAVGKLRKPPPDAREFVQSIGQGKVVRPDQKMVLQAIDTSERNRISFWDAMIIEAAVSGKCSILLTEDLNHGQVVRGVRITNPFLAH